MSLSDDARAEEQTEELRKVVKRLGAKVSKLESQKVELEAIAREAFTDAIGAYLDLAPLPPKPKADRRTKGEEVAVLLVSDQQFGKKTPDYNSEVAKERMQILADRVREIADKRRKAVPVKGIHRWLLGDVVEGEDIFPGQSWRIDASLYRQVVDGAGMIADLDRALVQDFDWLHSEEVDGNHGRVGRKGQYHPETNADLLLYTLLREIHRNTDTDKRITYGEIGWPGERNWYRLVDIGKFRGMLFHGDQVRGGYGGVPWYGFSKAILSWSSGAIDSGDRESEVERIQHNDRAMPYFDAAFCGHWHQAARIPFNQRMLYVNGTTESYNTWAQENLKAQGYPSQTLLFVDPEQGRVTAEHVIDLR